MGIEDGTAFADSGPEEPALAHSEAEVPPDEDLEPETVIERLRQLGDHAIGAVAEHREAVLAGAVIVGAAVALIAARRKGYFLTSEGRRASIHSGDRHMDGVTSIVERTEPRAVPTDSAMSFPVSAKALAALRKNPDRAKELFFMTGAGDFAYPLSGDEAQLAKYQHAIQRARGWLMGLLSAEESSGS